jgi:hypothetical protein
MNEWFSLMLLLILLISMEILGNMRSSNLIQVQINKSRSEVLKQVETTVASIPEYRQLRIEDNSTIRYTRDELLKIWTNIQYDRRYRILDVNACLNIRELRINKKRKRGTRSGKHRRFRHQDLHTSRNVNFNNIIPVCITKEVKQHNKYLTITTINARSIKNKDVLIADYLQEIKTDICIVTETWLSEQDSVWIDGCELNKNGFRCRVMNRVGRPGGGLACIHRSQYAVKLMEAVPTQTFEYGVWNVKLSDSENINIVGIYHPPPSEKSASNSSFIDELSVFLAENILSLNNIIIIGDFNIHVNETEENEVLSFTSILEALGLDQHVWFPTHNKGNTIDLVYTECVSKLQVIECKQGSFLSDHCAVICTTSLKKSNISRDTITYRKLKNIDVELFLNDIQLDKYLFAESDTNKLYDSFVKKATAALDSHAPLKEKTITLREKNPWYNENLREQKRICRKKERMWKNCQTDSSWQVFKKERRIYKQMLQESKRKSLSEKISECGRDVKQLYKLVKHLTGTKPDNPLPPRGSDLDLTNEFAEYFISKIKNIRDSLENMEKYVPVDSKEIPILTEFSPLSENEVKNIITKMATKSCELDAIPTEILKKGLNGLLPVITNLVNISLKEGVFAESWKVAIVRPLLKKTGAEAILSNYRPVSNLSFISKIVEKAALLRFNAHCKTHELMPDYQSAYRSNASCETALIKLLNDVLWCMEKQGIAALSAIDLSAAFDTVDHEILLNDLSVKFGIRNTALKWFETYLYPRSCKVNVRKEYSTPRDLKFSVPQGSCTGPILYLVYASTLQEVIPSSVTIFGYADDHALMETFRACSRSDEGNSINRLEKCMIDIKSWMDANRLKMNATKTEFILFGSKSQLKKCVTTSLNVAGDKVERSNIIKYLGAWLDESLTLKAHISKKCRAAMINLQRIKLIRDTLTLDACRTIVQGTVISHLDYSNSILAGLPKCDINKLQRIQNSAAKVILQKRKIASSTKCRAELHWLPIQSRIDFKILVTVYKCLAGEAPLYLQNLLKWRGVSRGGLRSEHDDKLLQIPFTRRKTFADRSFSVYGPRIWNSLPYDLRAAVNIELFKKHLKTYLFKLSYEHLK